MGDASQYVDYLKANAYADKYFDKFPLSNEDKNILANVVPLVAPSDGPDDFFAPEVCNVIVLTGNYKWESGAVDAAKTRMGETWDKFKKYECHFIIDKSEDNIKCMSDSDKADLESRVQELCTSLSDFGFIFEGSLESTEMAQKIDQILGDFYAPRPT